MDELRAALLEALAAAGVEAPADLSALTPADLDTLVEDKRLRGRCKSALIRYRRALEEAGELPVATGPAGAQPEEAGPSAEAEAAPATEEPAPEPPPAAQASPEEPVQEEAEPSVQPIPEALAPFHAAVVEAFGAAGLPAPADPVNYDTAALDESVEDRKLRGQVKSALAKFRRAAAEHGWQPAPPRTSLPDRPAREAATPAATESAPAPKAPAVADVPPAPAGTPADLWLLTPDGWTKLGQAKRVPSRIDEMVDRRGADGSVQRVASILTLEGKFAIPPDLYNTHCYLAHEGVVYLAYYIAHVGDVARGTRTASLKVADVYDYETFARVYRALGRADRPTADDQRRARFGERYQTARDMFSGRSSRWI